MSKSAKRFIGLCAVLVILIAVLVMLNLLNPGDDSQNSYTESVAIGSLSGTVTDISFTGSDGAPVNLELQNDVWVLSDRTDLPLHQSNIERIANAILSLRASDFFEVSDELSAYGLETPKNVFSASDSNGTLTLLIGGSTPDGNVYVMEQGGDVIYTIDDTLPGYLDISWDSLVERDEIPSLTEDEVDAIVISGSARTLTFTKDRLSNGSSIWYVDENGTKTQAAAYELSGEGQKSTAREYLTDILTYLAEPGSWSYDVTYPKQADVYGFDPPALTVHVEYRQDNEKSEFDLTLGSNAQNAGAYPAKLDAFAGVYTIPADDMAPFFDALKVLGISAE